MTLLTVSLASAIGVGLGVAAFRRFAVQRALLDIPNERSSHAVPTPRGGGLLLVVACVIGWSVLAMLGLVGRAGGLAVTSLMIAAVSWTDDVRTLSARTRFIIQFLSAGLLLGALGTWGSVTLPYVGDTSLGVLGVPLAFLWIVGLTNAYNFMDGIDGIAGAQAVIAGTGWAVTAWTLGYPELAVTGAIVAGAALGFLWHNWAPARIFMGDVGSAFLGFVFAAMGVAVGEGRLPLAALLFVWPFVFDAGYTFIRRLRMREDVFAAHRSHLYQRMVIAGWSHRQVATLYAAVAAGCTLLGALWAVHGIEETAVGGALVPMILVWATVNAERRSGRIAVLKEQ